MLSARTTKYGCDEPISEICRSERDGDFTSERQLALSNANVFDAECVVVADLHNHKWQGLMDQ